jgi:hypothetical protein
MPVSIDEVTAEIEPARAGPPASGAGGAAAGPVSPEVERRRMMETLACIEVRAARIRAD